MNKIPKVFANKIEKEIGNNSKFYYGNEREVQEEVKSELNVNQKINHIFSSNRYVYKADVVITLKDKKINKKIIGRNKNSLITMDNELINIDDIVDIKFSN